MSSSRTADRWRQLLGLSEDNFESTEGEAPRERIELAREALERLIMDRFGADPGLLDAAQEIALTAAQAIDVLELDDGSEPSEDEFGALEAVVAFDGTRPSFLIKQDRIDFSSSLNTGAWQVDLQPHLSQLGALFACTGRVERGKAHIGTAFLVTPTLAITNRHVAQGIATFAAGDIQLKPDVHLDFGREQWNERKSFDRRGIEAVAFAGKTAIGAPLDHRKLDLAVLRVSASSLADDLGQRHIPFGQVDAAAFQAAPYVATVGYPSNPQMFAPKAIRSKFEGVLQRLLEGDGGVKRFAPGVPADPVGIDAGASWTVCHDATTINGNSGSPLFTLATAPSGKVTLAGLHYGGRWGGERVNWAHLLTAVGHGEGYERNISFADFCRKEGIDR
jgi:hypothetical protein